MVIRDDALIHASITSRNPSAVKNEAAFLTRNQPVLWFFTG
jgi:hypothetical protein